MPDAPMPRRSWLPLAIFGIAVAAAGWRIPDAPKPALSTTAEPTVAVSELPPAARLSPEPPSLTRLPNGTLAVAWLERGDAENAAIWMATGDGRTWRDIGKIASRESTAGATFMHAQGLGRPILWSEGGWLHLWYEAYPLGRWAGASIIHSLSTDGGRSWNRTQRLPVNAFGGLGSRLGQAPRELADGGLMLPLGQANEGAPWLRLAATGRIVDKLERLPNASTPEAAQ